MKEKEASGDVDRIYLVAVLLARLETVRIRENTKEVRNIPVRKEQEGAEWNGKRKGRRKLIGRGMKVRMKGERTGKECDGKEKAALTFDDGPTANTLLLLKGLKERGVHATFFSWGRILREKRPW